MGKWSSAQLADFAQRVNNRETRARRGMALEAAAIGVVRGCEVNSGFVLTRASTPRRTQRSNSPPTPGGDVLLPSPLACLADSIIKWPHVVRATLSLRTGRPKALHSGRTGGMRQLLVEMRDELKRFMLSRQCDPAEVDDLLQDLFVKLTTGKTGPVGNPRAYLYQMANNLLLDRRRGRHRQAQRDDSWARSQFGQDLREDPAASPERVAIDRNLLVQVEVTLSEMPERTADILRRYRLEGQSQKVIAEQIGISLSAVEKHLQRAYRVLLELRGGIEDEPCEEVAGNE
jgi:RNA polymerase sigma factor (sigma-70 family)